MGRWSTGVSVGGSVTYGIGSARRIAAARKNGAERGIVHTRLRSEEKWIWLFTRRLLADGREQFAVRNDSTVQLIVPLVLYFLFATRFHPPAQSS